MNLTQGIYQFLPSDASRRLASQQQQQIPGLEISSMLENDSLSFAAVHNSCRTLVTLSTSAPSAYTSLSSSLPQHSQYLCHRFMVPIDFIVIIDASSSMKEQQKLAFVQAAIEYMIHQLNEHHRFSLLLFNEGVQVLCELLPMTATNKAYCLDLLHSIKAEGSTNISGALFKGIEILQERKIQHLSFMFLLTDGLINRGLSANNTLEKLRKMDLSSSSCCIHTFGFGSDHDSWMLQEIAFASKGGVYYYVENETKVAATFGQCIAGAFSTVAHSIKVRLLGLDGARMIKFNTRFPIKENNKAKDYTVCFGSMYSGESRSMIIGLSLRKMEREMVQPLIKVEVSYVNTLTQMCERREAVITIRRPTVTPKQEIPLELSKQTNRFLAADAIQKAIHAAQRGDFTQAHETIHSAIHLIHASPAASLPYCTDLVKDLGIVARALADPPTFRAGGVHYAHAYSTMYYQERSSGLDDLDCYQLDEEACFPASSASPTLPAFPALAASAASVAYCCPLSNETESNAFPQSQPCKCRASTHSQTGVGLGPSPSAKPSACRCGTTGHVPSTASTDIGGSSHTQTPTHSRAPSTSPTLPLPTSTTAPPAPTAASGSISTGATLTASSAKTSRALLGACGRDDRSSGYGYITMLQKEESRKALLAAASMVSGYVCWNE
jgi:Mg-chelatase subunit ChlD